jgi:glycosyltransferase involved in cell wall biosynthesis
VASTNYPGATHPNTTGSATPSLEAFRQRRGRPSSGDDRRHLVDRSVRADTPTVGVVIPTKNEARNLQYVLPLLDRSLIDEVVIVDAGSTDGTRETAQALCPDAKIIGQHVGGKGAALSAGLCAVESDIAVMLDADGSMDPREIPAYVGALVAGADLAKGSRLSAGATSHDITLLRSAGNFALRTAVNLLFRQRWSELAYGYAAMWTDILRPLRIDEIDTPGTAKGAYGTGFEIETLLFTRSVRAGLRVVEVSSIEFDRVHGETNLNTFRDGFRCLSSLLRERFGRRPRIDTTEQYLRPIAP